MTKKNENEETNPVGRPTVVTPEVVKKLTDAFLDDLNIKQAYMSAGISKQTYYNFIEAYPEFVDFFKLCRENLKIKAKKTIAKEIPNDPALALKYLKLRENDYKDKIEHSTDESINGAACEALKMITESFMKGGKPETKGKKKG